MTRVAAVEEEVAEVAAAVLVALEVLLTAKAKEVDVRAREAAMVVKLNLKKRKRLPRLRVRRGSVSADLVPIEVKRRTRMKPILQESEVVELATLAVEAVVSLVTTPISLVKGLARTTGIESRKTVVSQSGPSLNKREVALAADLSLVEELKASVVASSLPKTSKKNESVSTFIKP